MTANLIGTWDGKLLFPSVLLYALRISIETQSSDEKVVGVFVPSDPDDPADDHILPGSSDPRDRAHFGSGHREQACDLVG